MRRRGGSCGGKAKNHQTIDVTLLEQDWRNGRNGPAAATGHTREHKKATETRAVNLLPPPIQRFAGLLVYPAYIEHNMCLSRTCLVETIQKEGAAINRSKVQDEARAWMSPTYVYCGTINVRRVWFSFHRVCSCYCPLHQLIIWPLTIRAISVKSATIAGLFFISDVSSPCKPLPDFPVPLAHRCCPTAVPPRKLT